MIDDNESLRTRLAKAIHDGPNAREQYRLAGIEPHSADDCPHFDQYLADADAVLESLSLLVVESLFQSVLNFGE